MGADASARSTWHSCWVGGDRANPPIPATKLMPMPTATLAHLTWPFCSAFGGHARSPMFRRTLTILSVLGLLLSVGVWGVSLFVAILERIRRFSVPPPLVHRGGRGDRTRGWRFVERKLMLRGTGPHSLLQRCQGQDWPHEAGKWARFAAREVVFAGVESSHAVG